MIATNLTRTLLICRQLTQTALLLLFTALVSLVSLAAQGDWLQISYPIVAQEVSAQSVNLTNTARAPPTANANVTSTGTAPAQTGYNMRALDGAETTGVAYAILRSTIAPKGGEIAGTNAKGELTSRSSFRRGVVQDAWDNAAEGPAGGKLCPSCGKEVAVPPHSGQPRDWDVSYNPSWTNREFDPNVTARQDVIDNYQQGTSLECPGCNRSGGNNDVRFNE